MVFKKLPARGTTAVEFPSGTSTSCTMTEWTDESASGTSESSYAMLSRRPSRPSMRKKSLTRQYAQRKYSSSSSSSSSPGWLVSRPASSLRRQRAVREEPKKRGRLRRFKDKLAVIFHHHHHHHHHRSSSGDSEEESPTPSEDPRHGGSMPEHLGKIQGGGGGGGGAVIRAPCRREEHQHGHLYTLLQRLLRHIWDSRMEEEDKVCRRREMGKKGVGRNGDKKKGWWQGGGGVKLGISRKKQRFVLGFPKAQRKKTQVLCDEKEY